jgi:hypothetical protein
LTWVKPGGGATEKTANKQTPASAKINLFDFMFLKRSCLDDGVLWTLMLSSFEWL